MLKSKFESLRDIIKKDIISGKYLPGTNLPTEGEFRETYGVNHSTINKAVASLATEGFISTKPRTGSIVLPVKDRKVPARLGVYAMRSTGHIFEKLNSEILNVLQKNYYFPLLINLDFTLEDKNFDWLLSHLEEAIQSMPEFIVVDGQSGFPFDFLLKRSDEIENLIIINRFECEHDIPSIKILSDYEAGGYLATKHLIDSGCQKFLAVLGMREVLQDDINISFLQIKGIKKALKEHNFNSDELIFIAKNDKNFDERIKSIFKSPNAPDGILADSDFTAYKTIQTLNKFNIKYRHDYKLVGYFDTPWARESAFPFDTVSINQKGIADKLDEIITKKIYNNKTWKIKPELKTYE
jgi:DNA-binding LacI/PurR family transcriptional regulator